MRSPIRIVIALGLIATMLVGAQTQAAAHDPTCHPDPETGRAQCTHDSSEHGDGEEHPGSGITEEVRWNRYLCDIQTGRAYQDGYTVGLTVMNQIPHENYDEINADTSAPGYRFLEAHLDYFVVLVSCQYPGSPPGGTLRVFSGPELNTGPDPFALREEALAQVVLPDPDVQTNPPHSTADRFGLVRIPTWFWMDPSNFDAITEEATDPAGTLTVSVTATPQYATWDPGDGTPPIQCSDEGIEWVRGMAEDASDCTHTYTRASAGLPGNQYTIGVALEWIYTWEINTVPQGEFGTDQTETSIPYAVGEIQAVES